MGLVHRKRINSTLSSDNFDFISDLSKKTKLNQSKFYDLAITMLRKELKEKTIFELFEEFDEKEYVNKNNLLFFAKKQKLYLSILANNKQKYITYIK